MTISVRIQPKATEISSATISAASPGSMLASLVRNNAVDCVYACFT